MKFEETPIVGVMVLRLQTLKDERGYFARTFCLREFEAHGLTMNVVQSNLSYNRLRGTTRGMHAQTKPQVEAKLVQCLRGRLYDVALDLRPDSPTFLEHFGIELTEADGSLVYLPEGIFHGFQTLEDDTLVSYQMSAFYAPELAVGFRFDDPAFAIAWPTEARVVSEKDRSYPAFRPETLRSQPVRES